MALAIEFKVGQNLYTPKGIGAECWTIQSIGVKYLYVKKDLREKKVSKETLVEFCNHNYACKFYISEQEVLDVVDRHILSIKIRQYFDLLGKSKEITIQQIRKVAEILGIEK